MQKPHSTGSVQSVKKLASGPVIINAVLFQITWFACALGAAKGLLWPAIAACGALAVFQLQSKHRHPSDVALIATALALGLVIDSAWIQLGLISYATPAPVAALAPAWILILWVGFALTINHSLAWLNLHPLLPAVAGLICAPLSYLAGVKLGALAYQGDSLLISCALGVTWAIAMTVLVQVSRSKST